MSKTALQLTLITLLLTLLQVTVLNRICLGGFAVPIVFFYVILRLPVTMLRELLFTIAFFLGLIVDIFSDTQGMNSLACTIIAALKRPMLRLYYPRDDELADACPTVSSIGLFTYSKYALSITFIYCIIFFIAEACSFSNPESLILRILGSAILSGALIIGIDCLTVSRHAKRL